MTKRDYYAGGLICLIGAGAALEGISYKLGSLTQVGPGLYPFVIGVVLFVVGIGIAVVPTVEAAPDLFNTVPPFDYRGGICIISGALLFIVLGNFFGFVPAIFSCVFVAALGDRANTLRNAVVLALAMTIFGVVLFSLVLNVPFPLLQWLS